MELNLNWNRKGMNCLADHIREDGELFETPALMLLDMVVALRARLAAAEQERDELRREQAAWRRCTEQAESTVDKAEKDRDQACADLAKICDMLAQDNTLDAVREVERVKWERERDELRAEVSRLSLLQESHILEAKRIDEAWEKLTAENERLAGEVERLKEGKQ